MMTEPCVYLNPDGWYYFIPENYYGRHGAERGGPFEKRDIAGSYIRDKIDDLKGIKDAYGSK